MSQINFISDNQKVPKSPNKKKNDSPKIEWSKPMAGNNIKSPDDFKDTSRADQTGIENKNTLLNRTANMFAGFQDWLGRFKPNKEDRVLNKNVQPKKDKEILADYQKVFNSEKSKKRNSASLNASVLFSKNQPLPAAGQAKVKNSHEIAAKDERLKKDKWAAAKILKTDLIKDEVTIFFDWKKNLTGLLINLCLACLIIGTVYGGVMVWEKQVQQENEFLASEADELAQKIKDVKKNIATVENFRKRLKLVSMLLDKHIYWTNFFDFLEKNTLKNVYYTEAFSGNSQGKYTFKAETDSFAGISDQIIVMELNDNVLEAKVNKGEVSDKSDKNDEEKSDKTAVSFQIELSLDPKIFNK